MVLVNTDYISGKELEMLGMVKGSTIQCKNIGRDIGASFKNLVGGEMKAYTEMMNEARDLAIQRMVEEAEGLGADAVVNIRFATSAIIQGAAEVIAYGTAVKFVNKMCIRDRAMTIILENLNGIAAIGIGIGLMTIVGQCIGAGEKEQAVYYIKMCIRDRWRKSYHMGGSGAAEY